MNATLHVLCPWNQRKLPQSTWETENQQQVCNMVEFNPDSKAACELLNTNSIGLTKEHAQCCEDLVGVGSSDILGVRPR